MKRGKSVKLIKSYLTNLIIFWDDLHPVIGLNTPQLIKHGSYAHNGDHQATVNKSFVNQIRACLFSLNN